MAENAIKNVSKECEHFAKKEERTAAHKRGGPDVSGLQRGLDGLHLVAASFISLAFAFGKSSLISLRLLSPQSLKGGFAGAPVSIL